MSDLKRNIKTFIQPTYKTDQISKTRTDKHDIFKSNFQVTWMSQQMFLFFYDKFFILFLLTMISFNC